MAKNIKQTSKSVASKASKILKDKRYGKNSKSVAGSALAQTSLERKSKVIFRWVATGSGNRPTHLPSGRQQQINLTA